MRILFAVCSWGLGHIMRSLPIIRELSKENKIFVVTHGRSLTAAKENLKDFPNIEFIDLPDYPLPYTKNPFLFLPKFVSYIPEILHNIKKEHQYIEKIIRTENIKLIISDTRYGIYSNSKKINSYFITNQLKYIAPFRMTLLTEFFNSLFQKKFKKILIPDFPEFESSLSGELNHNLKFFNRNKLVYYGIISNYKKIEVKEDIDVFFSISGPEPQRTVFENLILSQAKKLDKKIVISLGTPEKKFFREENNIKVYSYLSEEKREEILNRSKIVVSRSGYSTIMDLAELEKKAFFIPTKYQTEQEYLVRFHLKQGNCYFKDQEKINLESDLKEAEKYRGLKAKWKTKKSINIFLENLF